LRLLAWKNSMAINRSALHCKIQQVEWMRISLRNCGVLELCLYSFLWFLSWEAFSSDRSSFTHPWRFPILKVVCSIIFFIIPFLPFNSVSFLLVHILNYSLSQAWLPWCLPLCHFEFSLEEISSSSSFWVGLDPKHPNNSYQVVSRARRINPSMEMFIIIKRGVLESGFETHPWYKVFCHYLWFFFFSKLFWFCTLFSSVLIQVFSINQIIISILFTGFCWSFFLSLGNGYDVDAWLILCPLALFLLWVLIFLLLFSRV